jgi:8-oxo-dGTP pyrophosphatase MutT (NUDIX family)
LTTRYFGAAIVVWRDVAKRREWLVLRRRYAHGPDWRWTPPSGVREAGETDAECARRELLEETGLELEPVETPCGSADWPVYAAQASAGAHVRLDDEHDDFDWVPLEEALSRCLPQLIADQLACVAAWLDR